MSEPKAEYKTETAVEITEHRCPNPKCETVFGAENPNGYLDIGGMIVDIEIIRGKCAICGATIKWYSTDYRMERMLRGRKKLN